MRDYIVITVIAALTLILCVYVISYRAIDVTAVLIPTPGEWLLVIKGHNDLEPLNATLKSNGILKASIEIPKGRFLTVVVNGLVAVKTRGVKVYWALFNDTCPLKVPSKLPLIVNTSSGLTLNSTLSIMPGDVMTWVKLDNAIFIHAFYNCLINRICVDNGNCLFINSTNAFVNSSNRVIVFLKCPNGRVARLIVG